MIMRIFRLVKIWIYRTDKSLANMDPNRRAAILDLINLD